MVSIYDEINKIKREGNPYDNNLGDPTKDSPKTSPKYEEFLHHLRTKSNTPDIPIFSQNFPGYGKSKYDKGLSYFDEMSPTSSLEDIRSKNQPWYSQIANGIVNMGTIAGTTFVDSFAGTVAGAVHMLVNPNGEYKTNDEGNPILDENGNPVPKNYWESRKVGDFINNPVSIFLQSINKYVEDKFPIYASDKYRENQATGKWYNNIFTPEFLSESIIKNAGFTVGMAGSGKVSGALLGKIGNVAKQLNVVENGISDAVKAGKLTGTVQENLTKALSGKLPLTGLDSAVVEAAKNIRQASAISRNIATGIAVTGEARMEGLNSSMEYGERLNAQLDSYEGQIELAKKTIYDMYAKDPSLFKSSPLEGDPLQSLTEEGAEAFGVEFSKNHENAKSAIEDAQSRVAVMDFALNYPILYGSSLIQFGRTFTRGYDTQKGFWNNAKAALRQADDIKLPGAERIVGGIEEGFKVGKRKVLKDVAKIALNPLSEFNEEMLQDSSAEASSKYAGSKLNSIMGYRIDPEAEQEQIGILSSVFNGIRDTYGDIGNYESGFVGFLTGSIGTPNFSMSKRTDGSRPIFDGGVWEDIRDYRSQTGELEEATAIINKRLQNPTFKAYYQGAIGHNAFEKAKTQAIDNNDKVSFDNADHAQFINDLMTFEKVGKLQEFYDLLDDNIEKFSTTDPVKVSELATELKELGTDNTTGVSLFDGKTEKEIVSNAKEWNTDLKKKADRYREISNSLRTLLGDTFTEDREMGELVQMFSNIDNLEENISTEQESLRNLVSKINSGKAAITTFPIVLQGQERHATFAEIINTASPQELYDWVGDIILRSSVTGSQKKNIDILLGIDTGTKEVTDYSGMLFKSPEKLDEFQEALKEIASVLNYDIKGKEILDKFSGVIRMTGQRVKLVNTYNSFINHPQTLTELLDKDEEEATNTTEKILTKNVEDSLKEATTVQEVRDIVKKEGIEKGVNLNKILQRMSIADNEDFSIVVAEYQRMNNIGSEIKSSTFYNDSSREIKDGINQLFKIVNERSDSIDEVLNPTILMDDLTELVPIHGGVYQQAELEEIRDKFLLSLEDIKRKNASYDAKSSSKSTPVTKESIGIQSPPFQGDSIDKDNRTGAEEGITEEVDIETGEIITKNKPLTTSEKRQEKVLPVKTSPVLIPLTDTKDLSKSSESIEMITDLENTNTNRNKWNNGAWQFDINYYNEIIPGTTTKRRQFKKQKPPYDAATNFLEEQGAFEYVNSENVHPNDRVYFVASTEYWEYLKNNGVPAKSVDSGKYILMVVPSSQGKLVINGQNYQVVGTFTKALNPFLHKEINKNPDSVDKNIYSEVDTVFSGRLSYGEERSLKDVMGNTPVTFGISRGEGRLDTAGAIIESVSVNPQVDDAGRLYLLLPGANGGHKAAAVRSKRLGDVMNDPAYNRENDLFKALTSTLDKIAKNATKLNGTNLSEIDTTISGNIGELKSILFVGKGSDTAIHLRERSTTEGGGEYFFHIESNGNVRSIPVATRDIHSGKVTTETKEQIASDLLEILGELNTPFQVILNDINSKWSYNLRKDYNQVLLDSGILTTNLADPNVKMGFFTINPIDNTLKQVSTTKNNPLPSSAPEAKINSVGTFEGNSTVNYANQEYILDNKGNVTTKTGETITPTNGENVKVINGVKTINYLNSLSSEELENITINGTEVFDKENFFSKVTFQVLPGGQIWNGNVIVNKGSLVATEVSKAYMDRKNKKLNSSIKEIKKEIISTKEELISSIKENSPEEVIEGKSAVEAEANGKFVEGNTREEVETKINTLTEQEMDEYGISDVSAPGSIVEEVDLFPNKKSSIEEKTPSPRIPRRKAGRSILDVKGVSERDIENHDSNIYEETSEVSQDEILTKIKENKEYQEKNCNGIIKK